MKIGKRILSIFLAVLMVVLAVPFALGTEIVDSGTCGGWNSTTQSYGQITWSLDSEGTLTISGEGAMRDYYSHYGEEDRTSAPWGQYLNNIKSVILENGISYIGEYAFLDCINIINIEIPNSVTSIGYAAFLNCSGLTNVIIPNSVRTICYGAFEDCTALNELIIGNGTTTIEDFAFSYCTSLSHVFIPDSVSNIGYGAFQGCRSLTSITIPSSVTYIEDYAFDNCDNLTSFKVLEDNNNYSSDSFGCLYDKTKSKLIQYPIGNGRTAFTIPDSVTCIGVDAFDGCNYLSSVTIPNSVVSIGHSAFCYCRNLTNLIVPDSVVNIGSSAFSGTELENAVWTNGVLYIGNHVIEAKSSLEGVCHIKEGTRSIADSAFSGCTGVTNVVIPDSVIGIGNNAFSRCTGLLSATIPDSVKSLGERVFYKCDNLKEVKIGNGVPRIDDWAFDSCTNLVSLTIGNSVTSIGTCAFSDCSNLSNVSMGNSVENIDYSAFSNCSNLSNLTLPNSIKSIGDYAFEDCTSLTNMTIPNGATTIGRGAFYYCACLESVLISDSVESIGSSAFTGTALYNNTNNWDNNVLYIGNYLISANTSLKGAYSIMEGTTYLSDGAFEDCRGLTEVIIPEGVKNIGDRTFYCCANLENVSIPESVTHIGDEAFAYCYNLRDLNVGDGVNSIGEKAFFDCSLMETVSIGRSVTSIATTAFNECKYLSSFSVSESNGVYSSGPDGCLYDKNKSILIKYPIYKNQRSFIIPDGITRIEEYAFMKCIRLTSVTIPESVVWIGNNAFYDCSKLTRVNVSNLDAWCRINFVDPTSNPLFYAKNLYCGGALVTSVIIPSDVTSILSYVFINCSSLKNVTILNTVTSIGEAAFYNCNQIEYTSFNGSEAQWNGVMVASNNQSLRNAIRFTCDYADAIFPEGYFFLKDSFSFKNDSIPEIDRKYFDAIYYPAHAKSIEDFYNEKKDAADGGYCYGMAYATAAILAGKPRLDSMLHFGDGYGELEGIPFTPQNMRTLALRDWILFGSQDHLIITLKDFILYSHIYQYSTQAKNNLTNTVLFAKYFNSSKLEDFFNYVSEKINNNQFVTIKLARFYLDEKNQWQGDDAHRVVAVGIQGHDILVDDPNNLNDVNRISIKQDFSGWSFNGAWETEHASTVDSSNAALACSIDFDAPHEILKTGYKVNYMDENNNEKEALLGTQRVDGDRLLLHLKGDCSVDQSHLIPIDTEFGLSETCTDSNLFWLSSDAKSVEVSNVSGSTLFSSAYKSIEVEAEKCEAVLLSKNDENSRLSADIQSSIGDEYTLNFSSFVDEDDDCFNLKISGIASDSRVCGRETETGYSVSGLSDATVTYSVDDSVVYETNTPKTGDYEINITINNDEKTLSTSINNLHIHAYTSTVTERATCEKDGIKTYVCTCGSIFTETVPSLGHIDENNDGKCDRCKQQMTGDDVCPQCGKVHKGFFDKIVGFFHKIIYKLTHLFKKDDVSAKTSSKK